MTKTRSVRSLTFELMARTNAKAIGRRMRERRDELDLSQGQVADRLPPTIDSQRISKWERGVHQPNDENLELVAVALETTFARLMMDAPVEGTPDLMGTLRASGDEAQLARIERKLDVALTILKQFADETTGELLDDLEHPGQDQPRRRPGRAA